MARYNTLLVLSSGLMMPDTVLLGTTYDGTTYMNADGTTVPPALTIAMAMNASLTAVFSVNTTASLMNITSGDANITTGLLCKSIYHGNSQVFISSTNSTLLNKTAAVDTCKALGGKLKAITSFTKSERIMTELALRYLTCFTSYLNWQFH